MAATEPVFTFDDILGAVKESSRGRWFLDEFENRLRKSDTGTILAAIAKLETAISGLGPQSGDSALVARAKAAIAAARKDIAALDEGRKVISEEGRLFAKLAEMAKSALTAGPNDNAPMIHSGVARALRLVDELDLDLGVTASLPKPASYFEQDSELFEKPAAPAMPPLRPSAALPRPAAAPAKQETTIQGVSKQDIPRGAKLIISRSRSAPLLHQTPAAPAAIAEARPEPVIEKAAETAAPAASPEAKHEAKLEPRPEAKLEPRPEPKPEAKFEPRPAPAEKPTSPMEQAVEAMEKTPRVVIIRRKPEELTDLPMIEMSEMDNVA